MASDNEASCVCDPNFAVICSFLEKFAKSCGITYPNFLELQEMLENSQEVPQPLVDLHVKLLRKARKSVSGERWERALIKFCHSYSNQDGWEIERFGYKKARLAVKLRILKMLLELQFDLNTKFKTEVNKLSAEELRSQPLGRDKLGQTYWCQLDEDCNLRVYREDLDDETWEVVAKDREGMVQLISQLSSNDPFRNDPDAVLNEDSNSLEIEKPIIDTGQVVESPADEEDDEEFEEIEDEEEEEDGNQHEKEKKSFSVLNSELKREDKASVKFTVKESQDETKTASISRTEVTVSNKIVKKNYTSEDKIKMDNGQSEAKRARDSVHVEDKRKTNASEIFAEKIAKFETDKEQEIVDTEKHATDHNKNESKTNKVTSKISVESKGSSTLQNTNRDITKDNVSLPVSKKIDASFIKKEELLGLVVKKGGEITVPGEKSKTSDKANSDAKTGGDVSIKKPCISVRPLEQLVSKDRCINPLKLEPKIILQKQSFNRGICSDLKEQMRQETVRKNVERNDFQQQKLKNEDFCKVIVNEIASKNVVTTNIDQRDETRGLHLEKSKWNEGGFDLRSPVVGNKLSGNDNRGLDLSGKKVVGIPYAKGLLISDTFHKTQENICDLSMRRPTDNYPLLKDMQKHSKNVIDDTLYKGSSGLATDLTLRKPNSSSLNLSQTLKEEKRLDNILKVDMKASTNVTTEKLKSVDCVNAKNNQDKDATISSTKRDINDTEIMQAKKPRFENSPKTIENSAVVGEAIEEPLMLIRGEGLGEDCNMENPVFRTEEENNIEVSEAIEEPVFFVLGEGSGKDCDTGNTSGEAENDDRNKNTQSSTTPLDEDKNLSANKSTDNNKEISNTGLKVEHNAGGLDKGFNISDLKTAVNPQIDHTGDKSQPSSFSSSKDFPKEHSSETNFSDEISDVILSGGQSSMDNEACSIKDKMDVSECNEWQLEKTNSSKMSAGDNIDTQLELAIQDKGMKDSINTKLKQFHSSSESLQTSSSQSYSFSASTVMSASCIQPSPSTEISSVSSGVLTSNPATDLTKSITSERTESSKIDVLPKEIGKKKLINKGENSHQKETLKIPHPLEFKPQETSFVSSTSKQVFPQFTSLQEPESPDVLDMSVKKDSLICVPSKSNEDFKMFSVSASKSSSSATSLPVESKSDASVAESPQYINIELDKTKSEVLRPSEAPLPVTKRFLHQTCSTTKAVDSITLKIPEPERGDIRGTVSPTKTPPKLWSIETICAPDQKYRESRDVPIIECGSSNPATYPKPELLSQILPNKPKWTLGVQVIQKSTGDNISLHKRISRWDVGKPLEESKSQETQSAKDSRSMTKDITSKVPNVDSFSSVKSLCVDRLSVDSGEQFGRKTEFISSLDMSKMSVISSGSGSMTDERLPVTTQESFTHSSEDIASSIRRIPSSNSSNYSSSCLNMPLDVRLYGTSMKHENPTEDSEVVSHNVSKSSLPEIQNVKLSSMSLQKLEKSEPLVLGNSSTKLPAKNKETVDSSSHIFELADKDKQSSLFSHQNFLEKEKIPKKGFFFGPGCFELTDKKSEVVDKVVAPDRSKSYNVSDKVENAEDKKEPKETTSISIVRKDVDKITTKSDASSERNIGKVVDFLTQKNAGKYFGTSTDKCVGDKIVMKGMASAIDRGGRKSTDSSGERSIDKVIGLLTEKSARMAETKNVEKPLDSNNHPPKDKIIDNSIKTANGNEKTISDINISGKGGNSADKTHSNKPVQNPTSFAAKKDAEENKQKFSAETKGGTAIEMSEKLFGNRSLGKELGENRTEEILFVTGISNTASKCDSSPPEQMIKFRSTKPKSDAAATKVTGENSKSLSDIHSNEEVERVKFSGIIENNASENSENQIEKSDNESVIPILGTLCKEIESTDISDDDKRKTITEHAAESAIPCEHTAVANKLSDRSVNKDKQNDRKECVKVSDTSEKITDKDDVSEKKNFSGNSIAELISSSISSVKKDEENDKSIGKPGEVVIGKTIIESTDTPEKTIGFATKKSEISSEKNENSSSKGNIKSNIVESDKFPEVEGNFCGSEIADKNIEKSIKTDTVLEKTANSETEKIMQTTEDISDMELDKNEENAVKSPEKTISSSKLSDQSTDVTEDITSTHVPSNTKDSIAKKTADICSEVTAERSPILSSKGDEGTGKMMVTSSANKEEKDEADRQKKKTAQDNEKNETAGPVGVKSLTVQGKSSLGKFAC